MSKTVIFSLIGFLILWIVSCGPPGAFLQEEEELPVELETIPSGTFITENTPVPLSILPGEDGTYPSRLEIVLRDSEGRELSTDTMEDEELTGETLPELYIPPLETGLYTLELSLFDGDVLIGEEQTEFFFVSGTYAILGISSFPPVIAPSSTALFTLNLALPEEADPYIVWRVGTTILSTGFYSDEGDELQWEVPESEGVYAIQADVYPVGPLAGVTFGFDSQLSMKAEVFVTSNIAESDEELGPASSYWTLFHFRGNLKDASESAAEREIIPNEAAQFAVQRGLFGFSLDGTSGVSVSEVLAPVIGGQLQPFSLTLRLLLTENNGGGDLVVMESDDGGFSLALSIDGEGRLSTAVAADSAEMVVDSGEDVLETGSIHNLTASFFPQAGEINVSLYLNGLKAGEGSLAAAAESMTAEGFTTIGSDAGYGGVLDELGVYYSSTTGEGGIDPDVYERGAAELYGDALVFAEGFDGITLPEELEYGESAAVEDGLLLVPAGGSVVLPELEFSYERLITEIEIPDLAPEGTVTFSFLRREEGETVVVIAVAGDGAVVEGENILLIPVDGVLTIVFEHDENGIALLSDEGAIPLAGVPTGSAVLQIQVDSSGSESVLSIDRILIYTENPNLVKEEAPEEPVNV